MYGVPVDDEGPLALTVGCTFGFETPQPVSAVLQVAPSGRDLQVRAEHWETGADHHGYIDLFGNRCERVTIPAGESQTVYEAEVVLSSPRDRLSPGTPETSIMALPDEHIAFVMPSRFCLPDQLGHEAWERFGDLAPGWERVQAIVDFVHGHLDWVAGASNPWTTAVDAYRAGQGVCRDFAHLAIAFCRALGIPARFVSAYALGLEPPDFHAYAQVYRGRRAWSRRRRRRADHVVRPGDTDAVRRARGIGDARGNSGNGDDCEVAVPAARIGALPGLTEANRRWWTLAGTCMGLFVLMLDSTVINVQTSRATWTPRPPACSG